MRDTLVDLHPWHLPRYVRLVPPPEPFPLEAVRDLLGIARAARDAVASAGGREVPALELIVADLEQAIRLGREQGAHAETAHRLAMRAADRLQMVVGPCRGALAMVAAAQARVLGTPRR